MFPPKEPTIKVGDTWVFTGEWTMEQMQALQRLHDNNVNRIYLCYGLMVRIGRPGEARSGLLRHGLAGFTPERRR